MNFGRHLSHQKDYFFTRQQPPSPG